MNITLLDYTGNGRADPYWGADLLIFAKHTRTHMSETGLDEIHAWSKEKKDAELEYIANTIPGSWELVDYTMLIQDVSRTFTHQLVRTRTASYAQQSMQINDHSEFEYRVGPSVDFDSRNDIEYAMQAVRGAYKTLLERGVKTMDAREILPTGALTNVIMKANLRTFVDLIHTRTSPRNAGEFVDVANLMRQRIMEVHPWAQFFLDRTADRAMADLDEAIKALPMSDDVAGEKFRMLKLVDQIRRKS
jgi:flavin-dependent thymidylate synthase